MKTGEREDQVLNLVEYGLYSEDNIIIFLEEEVYNDYCVSIGESRNLFLLAMTQAYII